MKHNKITKIHLNWNSIAQNEWKISPKFPNDRGKSAICDEFSIQSKAEKNTWNYLKLFILLKIIYDNNVDEWERAFCWMAAIRSVSENDDNLMKNQHSEWIRMAIFDFGNNWLDFVR